MGRLQFTELQILEPLDAFRCLPRRPWYLFDHAHAAVIDSSIS